MIKKASKIGVVLGILGVIIFGAPSTSAMSLEEVGVMTMGAVSLKEGEPDNSCSTSLFGMRPWYHGLAVKVNNKCAVGTPADDKAIPTFTWIIILNVMSDIFIAVGYLALGFVIYGGYMYLTSAGNPAGVAKGKKTLSAAFIGLAIVLLATGIVNFILSVIGG